MGIDIWIKHSKSYSNSKSSERTILYCDITIKHPV